MKLSIITFLLFANIILLQLLATRWRFNQFHYVTAGWNRDGAATATADKNINLVINPYAAAAAGPQTISTPYGNYVRVDSPSAISSLSSLST